MIHTVEVIESRVLSALNNGEGYAIHDILLQWAKDIMLETSERDWVHMNWEERQEQFREITRNL